MNIYMKVWMNICVIYLPIHTSILYPVKFIYWDVHFYASSGLWDRRVPSPSNSFVRHFYSQTLPKPQLLMCCLFWNVMSMESRNIQSLGSGFFHLTKYTQCQPTVVWLHLPATSSLSFFDPTLSSRAHSHLEGPFLCGTPNAGVPGALPWAFFSPGDLALTFWSLQTFSRSQSFLSSRPNTSSLQLHIPPWSPYKYIKPVPSEWPTLHTGLVPSLMTFSSLMPCDGWTGLLALSIRFDFLPWAFPSRTLSMGVQAMHCIVTHTSPTSYSVEPGQPCS